MSDLEEDPAHLNVPAPREPKIFRTMLFATDASGRHVPRVGSGRNMLGVRVPPDAPADVRPDAEGNVACGAEGLSVAPSLKALPPRLVPERLRSSRPGARGTDDLRLFRLGEGPFQPSDIADELELQPTSNTHGVVRPRAPMHVTRYQERVAATKPRWIDEG
jgi:hypothetical protein